VPGPAAPQASGWAWTELLHAEVAYLLRTAGIDVLHVKGPTVAQWLYDDDARAPGDVDVLVSPGQMDVALDVLRRAGFVERFEGVDRAATTDHAVAMYRPDAQTGHDEVDVHSYFPGLDTDAARAFTELWRRREPARLAHTDVWFPDRCSIALLTVLNTARSRSSKTVEDLRRLIRSDVEWDLVCALARRLGAAGALRAGLELEPAGAAIAAAQLEDIDVPRGWRLRLEDAPRTALRLDELGTLPWRERPRVVGRWLFPTPAVLRMRNPAVGHGVLPVTVAYLHRLRDGLAVLPASLRTLRSTRRS
jgi:hypothetical protein